MLSNIGLSHLAARTPDQYVDIAEQLSSNLGALSELRAGLRERLQNSSLMSAAEFTRDLEAALRSAWHAGCSG